MENDAVFRCVQTFVRLCGSGSQIFSGENAGYASVRPFPYFDRSTSTSVLRHFVKSGLLKYKSNYSIDRSKVWPKKSK